jgi:Zn-dependent peptidase ImmA (M78 family)/DNA-binding XRE family transcriptional regulator
MLEGRGDSPQFALDRLDTLRISFARELRGLTKKELASRIGKTPSAVSQIERGVIRPDLETFIQIAMALKVPTTFFMHRSFSTQPIQLDTCHFRARSSTSQAMRKQSTRIGELLIDFIETLERRGIVFPEESITSFSCSSSTAEEIEIAAGNLRVHWGMGYGPIPNMVKLLESKGIIVLPIYDACSEVDAYSTWKGRRPSIMLSLGKTASRARFDASHELGHLLMHEDTATGDAITERQANRFAGAFLAPRESFISECPRRWSLEAFRSLKFRWKMSISALLYRAKDLGCLSPSSYRRAMIDLGDLRKNEGPEWPIEQPTLVNQALSLVREHSNLDELAAELTLHTSELKHLLGTCVAPELLEKMSRKSDDDIGKIVSFRQLRPKRD